MTYFVGRGEHDVDDVLADIDLVVTGPHASALLPGRVAAVRRRSVHKAAAVRLHRACRRRRSRAVRAEIDPHVLYIEDPHPRAVRDANRPRPQRPRRQPTQRVAGSTRTRRPPAPRWRASTPFGRSRSGTSPCTRSRAPTRNGTTTSGGADGIRSARDRLTSTAHIRDDLVGGAIEIEAKLRKLATLDPATCSVAAWNSATTLDLLSSHDTMPTTPPARTERSAWSASRSTGCRSVAGVNRGDAHGEVPAHNDRVDPRGERRDHDATHPRAGDSPRLPHGL